MTFSACVIHWMSINTPSPHYDVLNNTNHIISEILWHTPSTDCSLPQKWKLDSTTKFTHLHLLVKQAHIAIRTLGIIDADTSCWNVVQRFFQNDVKMLLKCDATCLSQLRLELRSIWLLSRHGAAYAYTVHMCLLRPQNPREVTGGWLAQLHKWILKYRTLARLSWTHGHHTLWPGIGPLLGPRGP